jgi:hypothetical protein
MYVGRDFPPADEIESETYTFDFVRDLADGEVVISAVWYCTVAADSEGADANASDHVAIPAEFLGTKTMQHISGLVAGVKYVLQAVVGTDRGNTVSLWSHVTCGVPS